MGDILSTLTREIDQSQLLPHGLACAVMTTLFTVVRRSAIKSTSLYCDITEYEQASSGMVVFD